ncbi:hypothetical protein RAS_p170 (plasmid) [Rickettsia asiatica]|uniref:Uncharacterized protein n=1 Tax=Rickettsia asiatica TaxID=238800 RepID=A0A510GJF0_9RICK|nr:hypothetical protein RAS_p170 [Rickettsia asiatica]
MDLADANAILRSGAVLVYLPTFMANIFLTLPISDNVHCAELGCLNLINIFSFRLSWLVSIFNTII